MKNIQQKYIEEQSAKILEDQKKSETQFLREAVPNLLNWLMTQPPEFWKSYGMFWFNLQDVLQNHAPQKYREYVAYVGEDNFGKDDDIKKEFDYGSDINNWTAALIYLEQRINDYRVGVDEPHDYFDKNEEIKHYDPSIGFIDASEEEIE